MSGLETLQAETGHQFRDEALLGLALTHPSVAHGQRDAVRHNQRLEFLGDAVLQLILTRELYERFPDLEEGPLTKARATLVNRRFLAEQGRRLRLGAYLVLSRGEEQSGGRDRDSTLADAFEAFLGAVFLDAGLEAARAFVLRQFQTPLAQLAPDPDLDNPKGELQELLQADSVEAPRYRVERVTGPDHDRLFECAVFHGGRELGRGRGKSKKAAESQAARAALQQRRSS